VEFTGPADSLVTVRGLPHHIKTFALEDCLQTLANNLMVVSKENS